MNWEGLDISILGPAFCAGLLVLATHVPLGRQVLARGIIFIDLAIAQIAGLGVIAAHSFAWEPGGWEVQACAFAAALTGAALLSFTEARWSEVQEAIIGSLFVLAASGGILLMAANPQAGEHLKELLVGQILWVSWAQLSPTFALYGVALAAWFLWPRHRERSWFFYGLFAMVVTASVQLVGVYLVFASLIIPALAVRKATRFGLPLGYILGAAAYGLGLTLSALLDLPAGAMVVWTLAGLGCVMAGLISALGATRTVASSRRI